MIPPDLERSLADMESEAVDVELEHCSFEQLVFGAIMLMTAASRLLVRASKKNKHEIN